MTIEEAKKELERLSPSETAIDTVLTEINKLNNIIDRMAEVFSKISKGEYVTIEAHTEKDKIIEYFMKEERREEYE